MKFLTELETELQPVQAEYLPELSQIPVFTESYLLLLSGFTFQYELYDSAQTRAFRDQND